MVLTLIPENGHSVLDLLDSPSIDFGDKYCREAARRGHGPRHRRCIASETDISPE